MPDVAYSVEVSGNLETWEKLSLDVTADSDVETVRTEDIYAVGEASLRFLRLTIERVR